MGEAGIIVCKLYFIESPNNQDPTLERKRCRTLEDLFSRDSSVGLEPRILYHVLPAVPTLKDATGPFRLVMATGFSL